MNHDVEERWSARRAIAFIFAAAVLAWIAVILLVRWLVGVL